ncbi:hypothetical protein [Nocardia alni]|uniref:hypothetical protein n=1 Tax=Nocardia alni TaxID=2815723 RepID=UPI001C2276CD|nr:hypothetical protein [Nocardia alni]
MSGLLDRDAIIALLTELGNALAAEGEHADLFLAGSESMALAYSTRRATRDLDAVFEPKQVIYAAAENIARTHGLATDWLNDAVKGFLPGTDPNATTLFEHPGISVRVASPPYLFAMKAAAARIERDAEDLQYLYRLSGFRSVDEALDCVTQYYPPHLLTPKTELILRELLET